MEQKQNIRKNETRQCEVKLKFKKVRDRRVLVRLLLLVVVVVVIITIKHF
jgi:hypothetical protein